MSDYAVKVTIKNARILRLMRDAGITSQSELAQRAGVSQTDVGTLINMKRRPTGKDAMWRPLVDKICFVLGCTPEDMFTEAQGDMELQTNSVVIDMDEPQLRALMSDDMEQKVWAKLELQKLLGHVKNPKDRAVMEARLDGATFAEIGQQFGRRGGRIRDYEARAIRDMRSAARGGARDAARNINAGETRRKAKPPQPSPLEAKAKPPQPSPLEAKAKPPLPLSVSFSSWQ